MAEGKWLDDTTIHLCLNTATEGTTLNGLGDGARAISNATGDLDNGTELDLFGDFELFVDLAVAVTAGTPIAELYVLPSVDDTNFAEASTSVDPQAIHLAGVFVDVTGVGTTPQYLNIRGVPLVPRKMRFLLKNISGQAFASINTNTLKCKPYKVQSV